MGSLTRSNTVVYSEHRMPGVPGRRCPPYCHRSVSVNSGCPTRARGVSMELRESSEFSFAMRVRFAKINSWCRLRILRKLAPQRTRDPRTSPPKFIFSFGGAAPLLVRLLGKTDEGQADGWTHDCHFLRSAVPDGDGVCPGWLGRQ